MHVISRLPFQEAAAKYPNDGLALIRLYKVLKQMTFKTPDEMRNVFPSLDRMRYREKWWVIDIGGGNLRMMFFADFERAKVFVKHIVTHAEYDKLTTYCRENKE